MSEYPMTYEEYEKRVIELFVNIRIKNSAAVQNRKNCRGDGETISRRL